MENCDTKDYIGPVSVMDASTSTTLISILLITNNLWNNYDKKNMSNKGPTIHRVRRTVTDIFYELGHIYVRRAYRMSANTFWKLKSILQSTNYANNPDIDTDVQNPGRVPNGTIPFSIRLSIAIRYFAGGSPYDIALVHGVSHSVVFKSVWIIVDLINCSDSLKIEFPKMHDSQKEIALGFKNKSAVSFDNCVGAIDGIIIWIHKPSIHDVKIVGVGAKNFYCGRKKKFGINMQACCDHQNRFLDVSICHPGATSDYLSFQTSPLKFLLETPNFLAPGLCIYGDNAYTNTPYMATPYKGVSHGPKDDYNFYHSQLRINIECSFGMLVHRWGLLRRAMPCGITITKTTALTMCLCKLHNFCIDNKEPKASNGTFNDVAFTSAEGGVPLDGEDLRPSQLMDGGEHFTDVTRSYYQSRTAICTLPREKMLQHIIESDKCRPKPVEWLVHP
jgi:hypothetical protein